MSNEKTYLGDGVYAYFDGYHVVLTTSESITPDNAIYLDGHVWEALVGYVNRTIRTPPQVDTEPPLREADVKPCWECEESLIPVPVNVFPTPTRPGLRWQCPKCRTQYVVCTMVNGEFAWEYADE